LKRSIAPKLDVMLQKIYMALQSSALRFLLDLPSSIYVRMRTLKKIQDIPFFLYFFKMEVEIVHQNDAYNMFY
jgi:hypothetical protein